MAQCHNSNSTVITASCHIPSQQKQSSQVGSSKSAASSHLPWRCNYLLGVIVTRQVLQGGLDTGKTGLAPALMSRYVSQCLRDALQLRKLSYLMGCSSGFPNFLCRGQSLSCTTLPISRLGREPLQPAVAQLACIAWSNRARR